MARRHALGWHQPSPGWGQPFPGWDPLPDHSPFPFRAAASVRRWWWPAVAIGGFLAVVGYVFRHDPQPGLSDRSWLTVVLAAVVVVVLTVHRARRGRPPRAPLARVLAEYAVVGLLAVLLVTAGGPAQPTEHAEEGAERRQSTERPADRRPPAEHAEAGADRRPGIVRVVTGVWDWLVDLWRQADQKAKPTNGEAMAASPLSPTPSVPSIRRSP
jgi:hypothetical protein